MVQKILTNMYRVKIPLRGSPLGGLNSYVIKGKTRNLIIDTGWDQEQSMEGMKAGLKELKIDLTKTDFFITHSHPDHVGLIPRLATDTSIIYFNEPGAEWIQPDFSWYNFSAFARRNGFPENKLRVVARNYANSKYRLKTKLSSNNLKRCTVIHIGDFVFKCVETPGHSKGHMCLYEPNKKVLFSGDHILKNISPGIQLWCDGDNPLEKYLASLDKVCGLDIELVLPGHGKAFKNCKKRIEELKHHHQRRLDEILSILKKGGQNAFQVASQVSWDVGNKYFSWDLFPVLEKWLATGESIAHLKYLEAKGMIRRKIEDQKIIFLLKYAHQD